MGALPPEVGRFIFVAALIGAAEELLFRGYIQGRMRCINPIVAIVLAAAANMIYKLALFALPPESIIISFSYITFAIWTFIGGVFLGSLRELSGSVLPPLVGHIIFDIIVYGDSINAPLWVWS